MLIACHALVQNTPQPDEAQIREAIGGNLCRCTGYQQIVDAVKLATTPGYQVKEKSEPIAGQPGQVAIKEASND